MWKYNKKYSIIFLIRTNIQNEIICFYGEDEKMYLFSNDNIVVRKMKNTQKDKVLLLEWLSNPVLLESAYGEDAPWDMQKIEDNFVEKTSENSSVVACFIEYEDKAVGYIQYYIIDKDSYLFNTKVPFSKFIGGYGMDIFIGYPELWGKGIGTNVINAMANYLMKSLGAKVVCADPKEDNHRSVQAWIKAGFSPMGKIQNYDFPDEISILMAKFQTI